MAPQKPAPPSDLPPPVKIAGEVSPDEAVRQRGYAELLSVVSRGDTLSDMQVAAAKQLVKAGLLTRDSRQARTYALTVRGTALLKAHGREVPAAPTAPTVTALGASGAPTPATGSSVPGLGTERVTQNPTGRTFR